MRSNDAIPWSARVTGDPVRAIARLADAGTSLATRGGNAYLADALERCGSLVRARDRGADFVCFVPRGFGASDGFAALDVWVALAFWTALVALAVLALFAILVPFDSNSTALTMGLAASS
jgi:hypothetical protein